MKKTIAIPERLNKPADKLTPEERLELLNYGDQPMTAEEIAQRQVEDAAHEAFKEQYLATEYARKRRLSLAPLDGEGMDAMRKALDALFDGEIVAPAEYTDYRKKVQEIKDANPKGEK